MRPKHFIIFLLVTEALTHCRIVVVRVPSSVVYSPSVVARSLPLLPAYVLYTVYTWLQMIRIFRVKTGSVMAMEQNQMQTHCPDFA